MLAEHPLDEVRAEESIYFRRLFAENFLNPGARFPVSPHPVLHRNTVSQLGPIVQDLLRQHSLQGALVYEFCIRQAPDFQPRWDCGRVLHKPVVEERQPALDRVGAQQTQPSEIETHESIEIAVETAAQLVLAVGLTVDFVHDVKDLVQVTGTKKI